MYIIYFNNKQLFEDNNVNIFQNLFHLKFTDWKHTLIIKFNKPSVRI